MFYEDGGLYKGNFVNDLKQGSGIYKGAYRQTYDGDWENVQRHGYANYTNDEGE